MMITIWVGEGHATRDQAHEIRDKLEDVDWGDLDIEIIIERAD